MLEHLQLTIWKTLDMISCVVVGSDMMESGPVGQCIVLREMCHLRVSRQGGR